MKPTKKCRIIIPPTIYIVKFEPSLITLFLSNLITNQANFSYKCYINNEI